MKDKNRKCAICNISTAQESSLVLHRFPRPGPNNSHRAAAWARFCYPDDDWKSVEFQTKLHTTHKMLCSKHFPTGAYIQNKFEKEKLHRFSVPSEHCATYIQTSELVETGISEPVNSKLTECSSPSSSSLKSALPHHTINPAGLSMQLYFVQLEQLDVVFTARGLMPPVFTPLNDDYTIDFGVIPVYAMFLANAGIKSVLVGGTTGEHMSLSVSDRKKVIDTWVKAGKDSGLHIMVQVGGAPFADVIALAEYCSQAGVDSLLTLPELYFKPTSVDDLVSYVGLVANAAPNLPVLYYHIPSMSKVEINMPAFVTAATARVPNFKGIKFTSNDLSEGAQVLRNLKNDQEMFLGADTLLAPAALLGITSSIGTSYNLFPRLAQDIQGAVAQGDVERARVLQETLSLAIEAHTAEGPWVPIMKAGMEIVTGINVGPPALPQKKLSSQATQRILAKLKVLKLVS